MKAKVHSQIAKAKRFWRMRCEQMLENDDLVEAKELEIASLWAQLVTVRTHGGTTATASQSEITYIVSSTLKSQ